MAKMHLSYKVWEVGNFSEYDDFCTVVERVKRVSACVDYRYIDPYDIDGTDQFDLCKLCLKRFWYCWERTFAYILIRGLY